MKIAILGSRGIPASYSGIEKAIEETCKRLVLKGHEVTVYCRKNPNCPKQYAGITLIRLPALRSKHFGTLVHVLLATLSSLFKKIDIVHYHALGPSVFSFLPRLFGKKTIVTIHGLDWQRKKWSRCAQFFLKLCRYSAIYFPNRTIVVSNTLKKYFEKRFQKTIYFIPNGIERKANIKTLGVMEESYKKNKYILFVGRLVPEKGVHYLIKAFNELGTNLDLVLAGESSFTDDYVRYLKKISSPQVKFLGFVDGVKLEELYRNAYIFVLPSEIEGAPLALLEAMSYDKCVLSSNLPECREIIGSCGFYFKTKDYVDLKEKLQYLLNHNSLVQEFGQKAKERVNQFYSWDRIAEITEKLYLSFSPHLNPLPKGARKKKISLSPLGRGKGEGVSP